LLMGDRINAHPSHPMNDSSYPRAEVVSLSALVLRYLADFSGSSAGAL
jgi:hypothetical protein